MEMFFIISGLVVWGAGTIVGMVVDQFLHFSFIFGAVMSILALVFLAGRNYLIWLRAKKSYTGYASCSWG